MFVWSVWMEKDFWGGIWHIKLLSDSEVYTTLIKKKINKKHPLAFTTVQPGDNEQAILATG